MCYIKIGEPISHLEVVNYKCQCDLNLGEVCIECGWHFAKLLIYMVDPNIVHNLQNRNCLHYVCLGSGR